MKIISWNVNGIRSAQEKGLLQWLDKTSPDILCLQEIKVSKEKLPANLSDLNGYYSYFSHANKPGYSGTAIYTKQKPIDVKYHIGFEPFDSEGRFLELDFKKFILINVYLPHGGRKKEKLDYKLSSYKKLFVYLKKISQKTDVILVGDFNIAHSELDLARPKQNRDNIMFTVSERKQIDKLISYGFIDTFREFCNEGGNYTWWPYMANARARNLGWRIDYIFIPKAIFKKMKKAFILPEVKGSDHCPTGMDIEF